MGQLVGHRLKFDPADANQGAFFVAPAGEARVQVVACNKPGELIFMVPALPSADYTLEVRATVHGSEDVRTGPSTTLRTGRAGSDVDRGVKESGTPNALESLRVRDQRPWAS